MKKFCAIFLLTIFFMNASKAQKNKNAGADTTISVDMVLRMANKKMTREDSAVLRQQIKRNIKTDTLLIKYNGKGLSEPNTRLDSIECKLSSCNFEDNVNAMVLYDLGQMTCDGRGITVARHKRIKIFNEKGKGAANIRIGLTNQFGAEQVLEVEGKTINTENGKVEYTQLDTKLVYHEVKDKYHEDILFSMPNVKAGSVIEIGYVWRRVASRNIPGWDFQSDIPTQYSQFSIILSGELDFTSLYRTIMPLTKDSVIFDGRGHVWAMSDVPALKIEPFMRAPVDGLQSLELVLKSAKSLEGQTIELADSWASIGRQFTNDKELNKAFDQNISDKEGLVKSARKLPTVDAKVRYLFGQVKTLMKWNGISNWASKDGIKKAWENKSGDWGEINMILCHLLNEAGVKAYPLLVSTRDNGKLYRNFVNLFQINKLVTYVEVDTAQSYVLDASGKYNNYNEVPFDLLNSYGLYINKDQALYGLIFLKNKASVQQGVIINAEIKPDGTMNGNAQISSYSYNKSNALQLYHQFDEKKYREFLSGNDNNLLISSLSLENAEVDSLPLIQNINFKLDLPGTDDKYIYFNPNLFTGLHVNPFINERRFSDVDLGCNNLLSLNGKYKIPTGYKIEALPKSQTIVMPDKSISFKRIVVEEDGYIIVYYVINYKQSFFPRDIYFQLYTYFKKMNELLNEPIVLKKS